MLSQLQHSVAQKSRDFGILLKNLRTIKTFNGPSRFSKLFYPSVSVTAEQKQNESTTDLLARAGFIRKSSAGVYSLLPLGIAVQRKIESIIHTNILRINGNEVNLPSLLPVTAWEKTGRSHNTELYKLQDSGDSDFLLAPTHEEEVTLLVSNDIVSGKSLPLKLYQIGKKYRDEKRPRGGLLRGREFTMFDMYSFDSSKKDALQAYSEARSAYKNIFDQIGVHYEICEADSGDIGGDLSHEYHYITPVGEDKLIKCDSCSYMANVEVASSYPPDDFNGDPDNVAVTYGLTSDGSLIVIYHPSDRKVNLNLVKAELPLFDSSVKDPIATFLNHKDDTMTQRIIRVYDERVPERSSLPDLPVNVNIANITTLRFPCVLVSPSEHDEKCSNCDHGTLIEARAVEIGHTFYLGAKYSIPLDAKVVNKEQKEVPIEMGCYGIGVSRLVAAIAEITSDSSGLSWPISVCPAEVVIVTKPKSEEADGVAVKLSQQLRDKGYHTIIDDRIDKSFGWKVADSKLVGFPISIVIGTGYFKNGKIDVVVRRTKQTVQSNIEDAPDLVSDLIVSESKHVWKSA
ncbi:hypothetical protein V1514DRAFT_369120 [Lipomyces japonicus]|uniref:uncharacterized protein n=1 Tax=Lipomyces japonicus TaxID=56871 RepID=UPI0034CFEC7A